jgi:hypothetical protein
MACGLGSARSDSPARGALLPAVRRGVGSRAASRCRQSPRARQLEGIAKAKAAGVYKGQPASIDAAQVRAMKAQGLGASAIAKRSRSAGRRSIAYWRPADRCVAGETLPDDTRFAAHEKTPVACEKSLHQGQNRPDSRRTEAAAGGQAPA